MIDKEIHAYIDRLSADKVYGTVEFRFQAGKVLSIGERFERRPDEIRTEYSKAPVKDDMQ